MEGNHYATLKKQTQKTHSARDQEIRLLVVRASFIITAMN